MFPVPSVQSFGDAGVLVNTPIPFGKYVLLERINVGGMAEVFKAKAFGVEGFERLVAVKRILPAIAEDTEFINMFIDEAKIAVQLNHTNIAQIFDLGKVGEAYFIALEYVHGKDVRSIFTRARKNNEVIPLSMACYVIMKLCEGLDYAHNKRDPSGQPINIVHRDVSPQNILISYDGEVKIIDFGIAKAAGKAGKTQDGILKGKFAYMSPEQVRGLPLDRRSDLFSVGICLYEILTGERLFLGQSDFSTLERVRNVEIMPPRAYNRSIPEELEQIVLKALAKDVGDRYQTAMDLHDDLQSFMYTSGNFFARKDLSAFMHGMFADEIAKESSRDEEYRRLEAPTLLLATEDTERNTSGIAPKSNDVLHSLAPLPAPANWMMSGTPPPDHPGDHYRSTVGPHEISWEEDFSTQVFQQGDNPESPLSARIPKLSASLSVPPPIAGPPRGFATPPPAPTMFGQPLRNSQVSARPSTPLPPPSVYPVTPQPMPSVGGQARSGSVSAANQTSAPMRGRLSLQFIAWVAMLSAGLAGWILFYRSQTMHNQPSSVASRVVTLPIQGTGFVLNSEPTGARVYVDGQKLARVTPVQLTNLEGGVHSIRLESPRYYPWATRVSIPDGTVLGLPEAVLTIRSVLVKFRSEPEAAHVTLTRGSEHRVLGSTPTQAEVDIAGGPWTVHMQLDSYDNWSQELTLPTGETEVEVWGALEKRSGRVRRASRDDESFDEPRAPREITRRETRLSRETRLPMAESISSSTESNGASASSARSSAPSAAASAPAALPSATPPSTTASSEPATAPGTLRINTRPWSQVYVDGQLVGNTPQMDISLRPGSHRVTLVNPEFNIRDTITVAVRSNETVTKVITFAQDK